MILTMHDASTERQQLLHYEEILRSAGQFVTSQRRSLLKYLLRHRMHPTTAQIATAIGRSGSASLATVYNSLALFAELQIVRTLRSPKGEVHWDIRTDRHHHLVCSTCQRSVICLKTKWPSRSTTPPSRRASRGPRPGSCGPAAAVSPTHKQLGHRSAQPVVYKELRA